VSVLLCLMTRPAVIPIIVILLVAILAELRGSGYYGSFIS
jgi:hypothetical protein